MSLRIGMFNDGFITNLGITNYLEMEFPGIRDIYKDLPFFFKELIIKYNIENFDEALSQACRIYQFSGKGERKTGLEFLLSLVCAKVLDEREESKVALTRNSLGVLLDRRATQNAILKMADSLEIMWEQEILYPMNRIVSEREISKEELIKWMNKNRMGIVFAYWYDKESKIADDLFKSFEEKLKSLNGKIKKKYGRNPNLSINFFKELFSNRIDNLLRNKILFREKIENGVVYHSPSGINDAILRYSRGVPPFQNIGVSKKTIELNEYWLENTVFEGRKIVDGDLAKRKISIEVVDDIVI